MTVHARTSGDAISVEAIGMTMRFGDFTALDDVSLKIPAGNFLQRNAIKLHKTLIALHMLALIDRHRQVPLPQQSFRGRLTGIDQGRDARFVKCRAGTDCVRSFEVDHKHGHRTFSLGLQCEAAIEFERCSKQARQNNRFR